MRLQRLAEPREVDHDDACGHDNRPLIHAPNPRWPLSGTPESAFSLQCADPSRLGRGSPDAAEGRLRQVYAELGGMIGGNHKSERTQVANGGHVGAEISPQLTVLGEIPR